MWSSATRDADGPDARRRAARHGSCHPVVWLLPVVALQVAARSELARSLLKALCLGIRLENCRCGASPKLCGSSSTRGEGTLLRNEMMRRGADGLLGSAVPVPVSAMAVLRTVAAAPKTDAAADPHAGDRGLPKLKELLRDPKAWSSSIEGSRDAHRGASDGAGGAEPEASRTRSSHACRKDNDIASVVGKLSATIPPMLPSLTIGSEIFGLRHD
jgi:hypothetical protein